MGRSCSALKGWGAGKHLKLLQHPYPICHGPIKWRQLLPCLPSHGPQVPINQEPWGLQCRLLGLARGPSEGSPKL